MRRAIKVVLSAAALAGGGLLALATTAAEPVTGSGVPMTETRPLGDVTEVVLSGAGDLTIVPGSPAELRVTADDNVVPLLESITSDHKLTIRTRSWTRLRPQTKIAYTLVVPHLEALTVSGSGTARAERCAGRALSVKVTGSGHAFLNDLDVPELAVSVSGSGTVTASGTAGRATVRVSASGDVDAAALETATAEVRVSGSGTVAVWTTDALKSRVSGSGCVKYKGRPGSVEQKVSGSGRIRPLE